MTKKFLVYQGFNKLAILPKREPKVGLSYKSSWQKLFFGKVYSPSSAISLKTDSISEVPPYWFCKVVRSKILQIFSLRFLCNFFTNKVAGLQSVFKLSEVILFITWFSLTRYSTPGVAACTCNPATLETEFRNSFFFSIRYLKSIYKILS